MDRCSHLLDRTVNSTAPLGALWTAVLALAPAILNAAPPSKPVPEVVAAKVSLTDLDLTNSADQHIAKNRLSDAARRLCHTFWDSRKADNRSANEDCYRETLGSALQQLSAQVTTAAPRDSHLAQNKP